jgi:lipid-A-disaccharide synthase-like uncharacterized protein
MKDWSKIGFLGAAIYSILFVVVIPAMSANSHPYNACVVYIFSFPGSFFVFPLLTQEGVTWEVNTLRFWVAVILSLLINAFVLYWLGYCIESLNQNKR